MSDVAHFSLIEISPCFNTRILMCMSVAARATLLVDSLTQSLPSKVLSLTEVNVLTCVQNAKNAALVKIELDNTTQFILEQEAAELKIEEERQVSPSHSLFSCEWDYLMCSNPRRVSPHIATLSRSRLRLLRRLRFCRLQ